MNTMPNQVKTKQEVFELLSANQSHLQSFGVKRMGVFGSFARGTQTSSSDVDILIEFEEGKKTFDHFISTALLLEDLFQRKVELVTPSSLSPYIGPRILEEVDYAPLFS